MTTQTQRLMDIIEQFGPIRTTELCKQSGIKPANIGGLLASRVISGDLLCCKVEQPGNKRHPEVNEYRVSTKYVKNRAESATETEHIDASQGRRLLSEVFTAPPKNSETSNQAQPAVAGNTGSDASEAPPSTPTAEGVATPIPAVKESLTVHQEHAKELKAALDRIHELERELIIAKTPANWNYTDMLIQLAELLEHGVEIVIGEGRMAVLDGDAKYQVSQPDDLVPIISSITYLKERKVA